MILNCFKIEKKPEIELDLIDPETQNSVKVKAMIDTGFSGWVLVPYDVYKKVSSFRLNEEKWNIYATLNGQVKVRVSKCIIKIGELSVEGYVESPIFGRELTLVGRELLNRLNVEIKKGKEICVNDP